MSCHEVEKHTNPENDFPFASHGLPIVESVGGGAVLDRKLEMSPNVKHNTSLGVDQGFIFKLTKP